MPFFVINEWLWADLNGSNGNIYQRRAINFLEAFIISDHKLIIIPGTSFDKKAWALCKSDKQDIQQIGVNFMLQIRQNLDRCCLLDLEKLPLLPQHLANKIKPDDHYLVRAQLSCEGSILVTTDKPLLDFLQNQQMLCYSREEFLKKYFSIS